jgi:hypothetical protein
VVMGTHTHTHTHTRPLYHIPPCIQLLVQWLAPGLRIQLRANLSAWRTNAHIDIGIANIHTYVIHTCVAIGIGCSHIYTHTYVHMYTRTHISCTYRRRGGRGGGREKRQPISK